MQSDGPLFSFEILKLADMFLHRTNISRYFGVNKTARAEGVTQLFLRKATMSMKGRIPDPFVNLRKMKFLHITSPLSGPTIVLRGPGGVNGSTGC